MFKSHDMRISIEPELLRVFVEFIDVKLSFCHKLDNFKLTGELALTPFDMELVNREKLAHLFDVRVLLSPFKRYVIGFLVVHFCYSYYFYEFFTYIAYYFS
jgi:hypothetical protein